MDYNEKSDNDKGIQRFVLYMEKQVADGKHSFVMRAINQRMPKPEVILTIQSWLERVSDDFKNDIKRNTGSFEE